MRTVRSYLYVPGNKPDLFAKADAGRADAIIIDLEDAVPLSGKERARDAALEWLDARGRDGRGSAARKPVWVRVNPGPLGVADLEGVAARPGAAGVVLAKATDADAVAAAVGILRAHGSDMPVSPLLETPSAIFEARAIAGVEGVAFLQIGEYDLAAEVGVLVGDDDEEMLWARSQVVFAGAAAGITPPVGAVSVEIADVPHFETSTRRLARQGFVGRACIHPAQVDVVNRVFTPPPSAVDAARRSIELFDAAVLRGHGVVMDDDGRLVDEATVRSARAVLALAAAAEPHGSRP